MFAAIRRRQFGTVAKFGWPASVGLLKEDVTADAIYDDHASGKLAERPGLTACMKALRKDDVLVVWKLDRLGRSLAHLVDPVTLYVGPTGELRENGERVLSEKKPTSRAAKGA